MENETQDPQIVQPDDVQEQEQRIVPDEMTATDAVDDALESEPATIVEEEETPAATPQQPRGNRDSNIRRNPLTIIMLVIFGILFMLWLVRNCEGIKEEQKLKKEFRESFENRRPIADVDSTEIIADETYEVDHGERPSIEVRERRPEEPKDSVAENATENVVSTENLGAAAPTEDVLTTEPVAPTESVEQPAHQEEIPQPTTQQE